MNVPPMNQMKITKFLEPWIYSHSEKYTFLNNPMAKAIVINLAKKGFTDDLLINQLKPIIGKEASQYFAHKYVNAVKKISQKDIGFNGENKSNTRDRSPERVFNNKNSYEEEYRKKRKRKTHFSSKEELIEKTPVPSKSSFLSSSVISLRNGINDQKSLRFNEKGERIDDEGNIVKTQIIRSSNKPKEIPKDTRIPTVTKPKSYQFSFIQPGSIANSIEEKRAEFQVDLTVASGLPIFDVLAMRRSVDKPEIDWWDIPYVQTDDNGIPVTNDNGMWLAKVFDNSNQYENCSPVSVHKPIVPEIPTILTEEERKRQKHMRKVQKQNEERMLIKLNLKKPDPPKLKQSRLISLNGGIAVLNPSAIEMQIKQDREERLKKHEEHNNNSKLSPEEKKEKKRCKREADSKGNLISSVFIAKSITHPLHFAKITKMAQKWYITGGIFIVKNPQMFFVVTESGVKGKKKFDQLILNRIDWKLSKDGVCDDDSLSDNIRLVFSGDTYTRSFFSFKKYVFDVSTQCRKFFEKYHAESLFDAAASQK